MRSGTGLRHSIFASDDDDDESQSSEEQFANEEGDGCMNDGEHVHERSASAAERVQQRVDARQPPPSADSRPGLHHEQTGPSSSSSPATTPSLHMPPTASTPVTSHFDAILECLDLLRLMESDVNVSKQDAVDSIRSMLHNMLSTVMMHSFSTSMSVKGWRIE